MAFCWGKHGKERLAEGDTGEGLRQTGEGVLSWNRHRRADVLLKQACERTRDEGFSASNTHYVVDLHLSGVHRQKHAKKLLLVYCRFLDSGWLSEWCQLRQRHLLGQDWGGRVMFGGPDRRWWKPSLTCYRTSCTTLVGLESLLIFSSLREAQSRTSPGPSCWLRPGCLCQVVPCCWFLFTVSTLLNWTADVSGKCLWVDRAATADLRTELPISTQHRWEFLQRPFLNRSIPLAPHPFFSTPSGGCGLKGRLKCLRTIIKNRFKKIKVTSPLPLLFLFPPSSFSPSLPPFLPLFLFFSSQGFSV